MSGSKDWNRRLFPIWVAIALILSLFWTPVSLGANSAEVQVDHQVLFVLQDSSELTSAERVSRIHGQVQQAIRAKEPTSVVVKTRNQQAVIEINQRPVLTLSPEDTVAGNTPLQQATLWSAQLKTAIEQARQQRSHDYLRNMAILSALIVILAGCLHWGLGKVWPYPTLWLLKKLGTDPVSLPEHPPGIHLFLKISLAVTRVGLWIFVGLLIASLFPLTRNWSAIVRQGLFTGLTSSFLTLGTQSYSLLDALILLSMFLILLFSISFLITFLKTRALPRIGIDRGATEVISVVTRYVLITIGSIVLLQIWGLNLSSLTIVGSALGVGIGFGLQGIAKNFISGLVLLFERSIKVGDLVQVADYVGIVERVSARNLIIQTLDRISIIVPSSKMLEDIVVNWSHDGLTCRLHLPIGVAYGSELEQIKSLLLEAAHGHNAVLKSPPPNVVFVGFGESSLDFELLIWTRQPSRQLFIKSDLFFRIDALFREHQIEIPFPQRDLHLRSGEV